MRSTLLAVLLSSVASSNAAAQDIVFGPGPGSADFGIYEVSASAPDVVAFTSSGAPLVGFTVTLTNIGGNPSQNANGIGNATIGASGALHHEQVLPALFAVETPLASTFTDNGFQPPEVDSHFLQAVGLPPPPGGVPAETLVSTPSGVAPEIGAQTGFGGVLTGSYAFASTFGSVDVAYLVIEGLDGMAVDFALRPTNAAGVSETLSGRFVLAIPEPASALLGGAALPGFAAPRR